MTEQSPASSFIEVTGDIMAMSGASSGLTGTQSSALAVLDAETAEFNGEDTSRDTTPSRKSTHLLCHRQFEAFLAVDARVHH